MTVLNYLIQQHPEENKEKKRMLLLKVPLLI